MLIITFWQKNLSPLHLASEGGHAELCILLLDWGINVNIKNRVSSPLAVQLKFNKNQSGSAPIHLAAYSGHSNVVASLISHGAMVNASAYVRKNKNSFTCITMRLNRTETLLYTWPALRDTSTYASSFLI